MHYSNILLYTLEKESKALEDLNYALNIALCKDTKQERLDCLKDLFKPEIINYLFDKCGFDSTTHSFYLLDFQINKSKIKSEYVLNFRCANCSSTVEYLFVREITASGGILKMKDNLYGKTCNELAMKNVCY